MPDEEKVLVHYDKRKVFQNDPINTVGAGTTTNKRTIPVPGGTVYYVRKFGTPYLITDVTDIEDPVDANMTFRVYANDGTLMGSRTGGGAFVPGSSVSSQGCYMEIEADGGDVTVLNNILVDTNVDAGGLDFITAQEVIYDGNILTLYLSDTSSTYYDSAMTLGGGRHTPAAGGGDSRLPYFHPYDAFADGAFVTTDGVEILDREVYSFPYKDAGGIWRYELPINVNAVFLYSTDGSNPRIKGIIGADTEREVSGLFNNETAVFFNENGTNTTTGATGYEDTWHDPYRTIANAITAAGNKGVSLVIYGGTGATVTDGIFDETVSFGALTIEPEYGYTPKIYRTTAIAQLVTLSNAASIINGFIIDANNFANDAIRASNHTASIHNNNIINAKLIGFNETGAPGTTLSNNIIYGCDWAIAATASNIATFTINRCFMYNNNLGINGSAPGNNLTINIADCHIYDNVEYGIELNLAGNNINGTIENNTIYNNSIYGIYCRGVGGVWGITVQNNIVYNNTTYDLYKEDAPANPSVSWSNYSTSSNWTDGGNNDTINAPGFCKNTFPYKFGLSADSNQYRSGNGGVDKGAELRIIEINNNAIEINGIQVDGNNQFNTGIYIADTANHTGLVIKWCDWYDFQGIGVDPYDDNTDTDCIISNNKIYDNGNGLKLNYGGNTIENNLIYNNLIFGIWSDRNGTLFNHNDFYLNKYGLYLESNSLVVTIKNSIFHKNTTNGIFSEVSIATTYSCHNDAVNSNVNITSTTNKQPATDPLFISEISGSEDFNIKTKEATDSDGNNFLINSPCKDSDEDGNDIGAYQLTRAIESDTWKKYQFEYNPENLNLGLLSKGLRAINDALGIVELYAKSHKRILPFIWTNDRYSSKTQRLKLEYFSSIIPTPENELTKDQVNFRIHLRPTNFINTGSNATIDATNKTLTDSTKSWIENEAKGWHVSIKFNSGSATGSINSGTKILTVSPSPGWTADEWINYYVYYDGYYYLITDNAADTLTLADPNSTIVTAASIDWAIEKYFKIKKNNATVLTLIDSSGELVTGTYDYYIDFIEVKNQRSQFSYDQRPRWAFTKEFNKSGYVWITEEA
jgi:hypothetical protein